MNKTPDTVKALAHEYVRKVEEAAGGRFDIVDVYSAAIRAAHNEYVCLGVFRNGPAQAWQNRARRVAVRDALLWLEAQYHAVAGKPYDWRSALLGVR